MERGQFFVAVVCRYCDPSYAFPSQQDVINFAVRTSLEFVRAHPNAVIVVGSYTIGKERLFHGVNFVSLNVLR